MDTWIDGQIAWTEWIKVIVCELRIHHSQYDLKQKSYYNYFTGKTEALCQQICQRAEKVLICRICPARKDMSFTSTEQGGGGAHATYTAHSAKRPSRSLENSECSLNICLFIKLP